MAKANLTPEEKKFFRDIEAQTKLYVEFKDFCHDVNKAYIRGGKEAARKVIRSKEDILIDLATDKLLIDIFSH